MDDQDRDRRDEQSGDDDEDILEEASRESFPASDPPAWTLGVTEDEDEDEDDSDEDDEDDSDEDDDQDDSG